MAPFTYTLWVLPTNLRVNTVKLQVNRVTGRFLGIRVLGVGLIFCICVTFIFLYNPYKSMKTYVL